jgi:parallel beta-helix repeat protein
VQSILKLKNGANTPVIKGNSVDDCTIRDIGIDGNQVNQADPAPGLGGGLRPIQFGEAFDLAQICDNITIKNVVVNRNGDGTKGNPEIHAGVFVYGGSDHVFEDVEVYGNDMGCGIILWVCTKPRAVRLHIHHINYLLLADPGDDIVNGLWMKGCTDAVVTLSTIHTLGGNFGTGQTTKYTRGFAPVESSDWEFTLSHVYDCDQPVDVTGAGSGNVRFLVANNKVKGARAAGIKLANSARDGIVSGNVVSSCGLAGIFASGPAAAGLDPKTGDCLIADNLVLDTGGNGLWTTDFRPAGILIEDGDFDNTISPLGMRCIGNTCIDRQTVKTMKYGIANEIAAPTDGRYNEAIDCRSIGHTSRAFKNMHAARCSVGRTTTQSMGTGVWAEITWEDAAKVDDGAMFPSGATTAVIARQDGTYAVSASVTWAANAVGQRGIRITMGGTGVINGSQVLVDAAAVGETSLSTSIRVKLRASQNVRVEEFQSSGGNLNVQITSGAVVEKVSSGPDLG